MTHPLVALVGAGPGDPELVTLRAETLLGSAGVVVVDAGLEHLVRLFGSGAAMVVVDGDRPAPDALLAAVTGAAGPVVRLYRGDPWLHPAHDVERNALARAGIAAEPVAGVAVEVAVPALAGIPVHERHLAVACTLGPYRSLPAAGASRTLVASGADAAVMVAAVAATGDRGLPAALVPVADPAGAWRGPLDDAAAPAATLAGPALLVVGAVCAMPTLPDDRRHSAGGHDPRVPARQDRPGS